VLQCSLWHHGASFSFLVFLQKYFNSPPGVKLTSPLQKTSQLLVQLLVVPRLSAVTVFCQYQLPQELPPEFPVIAAIALTECRPISARPQEASPLQKKIFRIPPWLKFDLPSPPLGRVNPWSQIQNLHKKRVTFKARLIHRKANTYPAFHLSSFPLQILPPDNTQ
jgi:hypothetical protein